MGAAPGAGPAAGDLDGEDLDLVVLDDDDRRRLEPGPAAESFLRGGAEPDEPDADAGHGDDDHPADLQRVTEDGLARPDLGEFGKEAAYGVDQGQPGLLPPGRARS
jgi:hypothetical protein